jgi:hypothetical protein
VVSRSSGACRQRAAVVWRGRVVVVGLGDFGGRWRSSLRGQFGRRKTGGGGSMVRSSSAAPMAGGCVARAREGGRFGF